MGQTLRLALRRPIEQSDDPINQLGRLDFFRVVARYLRLRLEYQRLVRA